MIRWDPSPYVVSWNLPILNRPILWYGVLFALGFFLAYLAFIRLLKNEKVDARKFTDLLSTYLLVGVLLGARIFDILFYEREGTLMRDPLFVFRFWEGGLSSHGAVVGLIVAVAIFQKRHRYFSMLKLLDFLSVVAALPAACIRVGNFINQEILGRPSEMPWAVLFGHPADGSFPVPRHPVQLYEALFYLGLFGLMWGLKSRKQLPGRLTGFFLIAVFTFRFIIEFFKEEQSVWLHSSLTMGQWLSVPFILMGLYLCFRAASGSGRVGN